MPLSEVTTDQLAAGAGLSRSSFYFYFSSKQAVLAALVQALAQDLASHHNRWLSGTGRDDDAQREANRHMARVWREHGALLEQARAQAAASRGADGGSSDYDEVVAALDESRHRFVTRFAARVARDRAAGAAPAGIAPRNLAAMVDALRTARFADLVGKHDARADAAAVADVVEATNRLVYGAAES